MPEGRLADEAIALVRHWLAEARRHPVDASARRLADLLRDPVGLDFAVRFVDTVIRPESRAVAARHLSALAGLRPTFLPWYLRAGLGAGVRLARLAPGPVVVGARAVLRQLVRHLVIDATGPQLGRALRRIGRDGVRANLNLLGEAVLGPAEATRRLAGTRELLERQDVACVSIKVSAAVAPHTGWAFDQAVAEAVDALRPLYRLARRGHQLLSLDMEEYKDLDWTMAVFTTVLDEPEFADLEAGLALQAYLPDALGAMARLQAWAARRVAAGGAPIRVRVVKGANLPMERVDAEIHGWPLATWDTKLATDANYLAVLDYALRPEHTAHVHIGLAGHNLFDIAWAWLLAGQRQVRDQVEVEMLLGMAPHLAQAVRASVGSILLYTPVVHPRHFDAAIAYLVRRLDEGAAPANFMSAAFDLDDPALFNRERDRFLASLEARPSGTPAPNRAQDRTAPAPPAADPGFANTADSDPAMAANRAWAGAILARMETSQLGQGRHYLVGDAAALEALIERTAAGAADWRDRGAEGRAEILHRAGDLLQARRADLIEVMGAECAKVIEQGDPEVSEAIDFAHYYADQALGLDRVDGARFTPAPLTVVTPPWNFPVAIPAGSTLAALAAGSPVILKPARAAARCATVLAEALWAAGVPRSVLGLARLPGPQLGRQLVCHPQVSTVVLTGSYDTAAQFLSWRADLRLLAETSGKNALIVTDAADLDLAARDAAASAFGHAGQKCSAASLVILVGATASSRRFRDQLLDATAAWTVGWPWQATSRIGPLIGPAEGKLAQALTSLEPGQRWLLRPRQLDQAGTMWTPGIVDGVQPGSRFHRTEFFGPVLGIMRAATLEEAIGLANAVDYGLTAGLHSLDESEIASWLAQIQAGNLYVNRGTTGAIVGRQPFGGWKKSVVGTGAKAGGPHYLAGLGSWADAPPTTRGPLDRVAQAALAVVGPGERAWLAAALATDLASWRAQFSQVRDIGGLAAEHNLLRYAAVPVTLRFEAGPEVELVRLVAAGRRAGSALTISTARPLSGAVGHWLRRQGLTAHQEDPAAWRRRAAALAASGGRLRLIGADLASGAEATGRSAAVAVQAGAVVSAGRIELLGFLREQAVAITAHRLGTPRHYNVPALVG